MSQFDYQQFYDRNLPHIQPPGATLFVTFRLDGSIPQAALEEWLREKKQWAAECLRREAIRGALLDPDVVAKEKLSFQRRWFRKFEDLLHEGSCGPVWLKDERVAAIVAEALHYRDGKVYRLDAYCLMPNHVHVVFAPLLSEELARELAEKRITDRSPFRSKGVEGKPQTDSLRYGDDDPVLASIMQSLKGYTARKCNLALGRRGTFWEHESFDHVIRTPQAGARIVDYVLNNPVKAGLVKHWREWKWNYHRPSPLESDSKLPRP